MTAFGLLGEDFQNHNRVGVRPADNSPGHALIYDPQFVAAECDLGHGSRKRERQRLAPLELPEEEARFNACRFAERWRLHFSMEPDERLVLGAHPKLVYVGSGIYAS